MITWDNAIKKALDMMTHRDQYAYFYGAKGQKLTKSTMEALWQAEPGYFAKYTAAEKKQIFKNSEGKIGIDCSAFTGMCTGDMQYSTGQINNCSYTTRDMVAGVAGSILYTTHGGTGRHIGIDIGYGYCLDAGRESTDACVSEHMDSVRLTHIRERDWEVSGRSNLVDYTGANNR